VESVWEAALLGLLQGLTEFLPVSSSGHLALGQILLGWEDPSANLAFNVAVHVGSLLAVLVFVRREIVDMLTRHPRLILTLVVATLPVALVGPPAKKIVEGLSGNAVAVGVLLLCTAGILVLVRRSDGGEQTPRTLPLPRALLIGVAQCFAILPGISRSGSTLAAGLKAGLDKESAVRFAFLMAAPAIGGAGLIMSIQGDWGGGNLPHVPLAVGTSVSFLASLFAMKVMVAVVARRRLGWFAAYCAVLGAVAIGTGLFYST
jgi:undecaprenyl-diphosphatase